MAERLGFKCLIFAEMPRSRFEMMWPNSHWRDGFMIARPDLEADTAIALCCLMTHGFGGHFIMSLKVTTGMVARANWRELHFSDHIRKMIAEMNLAYFPILIIMDDIEAFVDGGPLTRARWQANLALSSDDRIAIDAVGVAALKCTGRSRPFNRNEFSNRTRSEERSSSA